MKKILFISYDGMTDPLGQSQVIPYLTGLTKFGYEFTILSCDKPYRHKTQKDYIKSILEPFSIKWISIPYHKKPPVFSSVYDVLMLKKKARQLHSSERFDMVHTRAGIPALIGLWMKKRLGVKFLHDVREFYADGRVEGGMWNVDNWFYKRIYNFFKRKEEEEIRNCDGIVCLTYAAEKIIRQLPEYKHTYLQVIPCAVDLHLFDPSVIDIPFKKILQKELLIDDKDFIISYLGSLGGWYLTDDMMQFCKQVALKIPNAKFLFISPDKPTVIMDAAKRFGMDSKKILVKHGNRREVPALLSFSNYSVFFIKPCYSKLSSSPTKHGEIMAMSIPLITNAGVGDVQEIVEKYQAGFIMSKLNESNYGQVAEKLLTAPFDKTKIREGAKEFYSLENAIQKYHEIYEHILTPQIFLPTA